MTKRRRLTYHIFIGSAVLVLLVMAGSFSVLHAESGLQAPTASDGLLFGGWQVAQDSAFQFTRFDGEYSLDTSKVYFLGGRLPDGLTDGSVWEFDPETETYADTGVDMPVPVSNYQVARLEDAGGTEVLVIFGGRPDAGGVINTVQGYIPSTNSTVDYTATDPLPVNTAPGGIAVHDNIAYIFGGFDAVAVIDNTFFFDLTAAAGNRFTAGPALNDARSYIANAVVDGFIYALGGDDFDGTNLIPLTISERLDTSNPAAWDDASVADMAIACDETPAFGFDSDSGYDLAGTIVVAGCGQWPSEITEVQLYDVASNTWDTTFPDLNQARRNHAGAFIPTGDGTGGNPGMWVWGGRQGDDTNVLIITEYYQVVLGGPTPTATSIPPTETSIPPTATSIPPTETTIPPTATNPAPTETPAPTAPATGVEVSTFGGDSGNTWLLLLVPLAIALVFIIYIRKAKRV